MRKSKQEQSSRVRRDKLCVLKKFVNVLVNVFLNAFVWLGL